MLSFLQKYFPAFILLLTTLSGVSLGAMLATIVGQYLTPPAAAGSSPATIRQPPPQRAALKDYAAITRENIFDSVARKSESISPLKNEQSLPATQTGTRSDLKLLGTVVADGNSLALIESEKITETYRLGDAISGGGHIETIDRMTVGIMLSDGSWQILSLYDEGNTRLPTPAPSGVSASDNGIRPLGENRWAIDPMVANNARENIGELLKSTRMEPRIVNGTTSGFAVKMIRPQSLLAKMGLRRDDVIMQINDVTLDSPEKALQVFQLLREARTISVSLERNGTPTTFEYEIN